MYGNHIWLTEKETRWNSFFQPVTIPSGFGAIQTTAFDITSIKDGYKRIEDTGVVIDEYL